ncbi:ATP-binding protein [Solimonas marina]|uniref:histidine kinase n=1 Tax=Solimonas marina TaxID=2714601 RepID=A0A969WDL0_9GAMM|nr:ATP-binding protein [Solimonas marina]NKF24599.1 HAMP domain-containing protein [Solimonas marina]
MIGLTLRLTVLMTATVLLVMLTMFGAYYAQQPNDNRAELPLIPERVAAIVRLLDATPPAETERTLQAINSFDFQVTVHDGPLRSTDDEADFPLMRHLIRRGLPTDRSRPIEIRAGDADSSLQVMVHPSGFRRGPLRIAVQLHDGRVVEIKIRGGALGRSLRRPFIAIVLLLLGMIGLGALWGLRGQIRPIEALAREVERVGTADEGPPLQARGAREVRQLVVAFNRMRERLHRLIEGRTRMLAAISHDLGTYLTRLRLRIDLIDDADQRARAERDLHDMQQLLRDTLALARVESGGEHPREPVDLAALAAREVGEQQAAGAVVSLQTDDEAIAVSGHPLSLARVFANLIGNAIRYAGSAEVTVRRTTSGAEILVDDRGPGIPADEREAALEPFYRRDEARTLDDGGSGLGLAIVADIVRRHGGSLQLDDRPGGGLRVRVQLPT